LFSIPRAAQSIKPSRKFCLELIEIARGRLVGSFVLCSMSLRVAFYAFEFG
jgi:hypothetical protein